ncbi:hypothetical protein NLJ89_g473 [Agrocybe chaxingu]|uniref:Uncharacterized protein n=1 Tax=Agrocybe chaxingu TaxID=84603 RepID=A0A9W8N1S5_9AGAR|nr:hypothetical protein NLJ89_g473 [Agrocybe chaxingu]
MSPRFSEVEYFTARLKYLATLHLLLLVLQIAPDSEEISASLTEPFILFPAVILFPKHTRHVKRAAQRYLEKHGARTSDVSASSSDEEGYCTCPPENSDDEEGTNDRNELSNRECPYADEK